METTAFVLAGGGSLGCIQVGMLRALLAAGISPDFVVGSSVGALNACYFAGRPDAEGVESLAEVWIGLRRGNVFPFALSSAFALLRRADHLVDPSPLRRLILDRLPYRLLEEAKTPAHVVAADMQGAAVSISRGPAAPAILASAAVPGIFPTVEINGVHLMDGAVAANTPLRVAIELGATRVIILPTGYACDLQGPPSGAVARGLHAVTLLIAWQLVRELERLSREFEIYLAPALCPLNVSPYDFSQARTLIERATLSTQEWIAEGGLTRRACASELAPHHHRHFADADMAHALERNSHF
jgi:NTE family protein